MINKNDGTTHTYINAQKRKCSMVVNFSNKYFVYVSRKDILYNAFCFQPFRIMNIKFLSVQIVNESFWPKKKKINFYLKMKLVNGYYKSFEMSNLLDFI